MNLMEFSNQQIRERIEEAESLPFLLLEATDYLRLFYQEQSLPESQLQERLAEIYRDYRRSRTYWQTEDELIYGATVAWRNSTRYVGFMAPLIVRDLRYFTSAAEILAAIVDQLQAINGGNTRPAISIFAPDPPGQPGIRIWNPLLARCAKCRQTDGAIIDTSTQTELTELFQQLGWQGQGTQFDILPLIIQMPGQPPQWFELPPEAVMEVPTTHPDYNWFAELGLKWHGLPAVCGWQLKIGGISYSCALFNSWYMSAEMGADNFGKNYISARQQQSI